MIFIERNLQFIISIVYNFKCLGMDVVSRWRDMHELCKKEDLFRRNNFMDVHVLQLLLGAGEKDATQNFMESFKDTIRCERCLINRHA